MSVIKRCVLPVCVAFLCFCSPVGAQNVDVRELSWSAAAALEQGDVEQAASLINKLQASDDIPPDVARLVQKLQQRIEQIEAAASNDNTSENGDTKGSAIAAHGAVVEEGMSLQELEDYLNSLTTAVEKLFLHDEG